MTKSEYARTLIGWWYFTLLFGYGASLACCQDVVFSFHCPFYSVTGDQKAGLNTSVVCEIWACPGQTMDVSLCEESVGDNYIRLYSSHTQLGSSDDSCGEQYGAGRLAYSVPYNESSACRSFDLYQVCTTNKCLLHNSQHIMRS